MRNRDSVSRFWEGGKRGSVEQQTQSEGTKANTATRSLAPRATHSRQDKPYGKGGGEAERRQAERRGERGNPDQWRRTGEVGRREDLGSGKRMDLRP